MKLNSFLATSLMSSLVLIPGYSLACGGAVGWVKPDEKAPAISIDKAISLALSEYRIIVQKSDLQSRCGGDSEYELHDASSVNTLGSIPVSRNADGSDDGRSLLARLKQLSQTSKEQLIALEKAKLDFREDVDGLEADLGISAYVPNAYAIEDRTKDNGQKYLVYVTLDQYCKGDYSESPSLVYQGLAIKTLEYIPGRTDYSAASIYQKGDIKKAILADKAVMKEIENRIASNAKFCSNDEYGQQDQWRQISSRLATWTDVENSSSDRFNAQKAKATGAYMLNANRIVVEFGKSKVQYGGTISEMVEIQAKLSKQGIKTDKRSRLNRKGQIQIDVAREYDRLVAASLQE